VAAATLDWTAIGDEALRHLAALLRFDTTNPPGNERAAADYCARVLRDAGLPPAVLEAAPGRANCVARLSGAAASSSDGPLLLHGHLDVVPADPSDWRHPPFAGETHDGYVWGRGAVDMKNMVAMSLTVVATLARAGVRPRRDVLFAAVADEELGSDLGAKWLVDHHPDRVRAQYALGELGGFTLYAGGRRLYPVQVAEKGLCWLRLRARGRQGHGSVPHAENPVTRLGEALAAIGRHRLPHHDTAVMRHFLARMAQTQPFPAATVLRLLANPLLSDLVLDRVMPDRARAELFDALLHNTASPTVVRAGAKTNQIPSVAEAELDGRLLPGQTPDDLIRELRAVTGDPHWLELEVIKHHAPVSATPDTPLFAAIERVVARHDPGAVVVPNLIPGFTDAWAWAQLGAVCYGFSPVRLPPDLVFSRLYHGVDERVPADGVRWGVRVLYETVREVAAPDAPL
jgi:acetylornithine deacetylase/succinyl-diaminopimelate desuccinylase-like protein